MKVHHSDLKICSPSAFHLKLQEWLVFHSSVRLLLLLKLRSCVQETICCVCSEINMYSGCEANFKNKNDLKKQTFQRVLNTRLKLLQNCIGRRLFVLISSSEKLKNTECIRPLSFI